jgi:hypothetical protein
VALNLLARLGYVGLYNNSTMRLTGHALARGLAGYLARDLVRTLLERHLVGFGRFLISHFIIYKSPFKLKIDLIFFFFYMS